MHSIKVRSEKKLKTVQIDFLLLISIIDNARNSKFSYYTYHYLVVLSKGMYAR